jgi:hypothetical protein
VSVIPFPRRKWPDYVGVASDGSGLAIYNALRAYPAPVDIYAARKRDSMLNCDPDSPAGVQMIECLRKKFAGKGASWRRR